MQTINDSHRGVQTGAMPYTHNVPVNVVAVARREKGVQLVRRQGGAVVELGYVDSVSVQVQVISSSDRTHEPLWPPLRPRGI
jgi:hypothetical protein